MRRTVSILGCGWLGLPLAERLIQMDYRVFGSTTSRGRMTELSALGLEPFLVDIDHLSEAVSPFLESEILIISVPPGDLRGYERLLSLIEASPVEKVLFVSSTSVYPSTAGRVSEETDIRAAGHPLGNIEDVFRDSVAFRATIVRLGGLIGYDRHPGRFFPPGRVISDPEAYVNMIHRDDAVSVIEQIVVNNVWGETYNACADTHPTKRDFYTKATKGIKGVPPDFGPGGAPGYKIVSSEKVKRHLRFEFAHGDLIELFTD